MLKNSLAKKLAEKGDGFKRSVLSRKSGVTEATLYQIVTGIIKNPGVFTVAKIADALDCSMDELLERRAFLHGTEEMILKPDLFQSCVLTTLDLLRQKNQTLNITNCWQMISGIYAYCLSKNLETVDTEFANGFVENATQK